MTQPDGWQSPYNQPNQPNQPHQPHQPQLPQQPGEQPQYPSGQLQPYSTEPQPPYGAPPQYVYMAPPPKNDLGVWSLVTGILSWIFCPVVLGVVAIATGNASKRAVREGLANNPGMGTAGLILGWINVGVVGGLFLLWLLFAVVTFLGAGFAVTQS
jgi:hypothetical protein